MTSSISTLNTFNFENNFLEAIEELRLRRRLDKENEEKIKELVEQKLQMERLLDDEQMKAKQKYEVLEQELFDHKKIYEDKMSTLREEKAHHHIQVERLNEELKSLREEARALQLEKLGLEKSVKEMEGRLATQQSMQEHVRSQLAALRKLTENLSAQIRSSCSMQENLKEEVKRSLEANHRLQQFNQELGHKMEETSTQNNFLKQEVVDLRTQAAKPCSKCAAHGDLLALLTNTKGQIALKEKEISHLQEYLEETIEKHQELLVKLEENSKVLLSYADSASQSYQAKSQMAQENQEMALKLKSLHSQCRQWEGEAAKLRKAIPDVNKQFQTYSFQDLLDLGFLVERPNSPIFSFPVASIGLQTDPNTSPEISSIALQTDIVTSPEIVFDSKGISPSVSSNSSSALGLTSISPVQKPLTTINSAQNEEENKDQSFQPNLSPDKEVYTSTVQGQPSNSNNSRDGDKAEDQENMELNEMPETPNSSIGDNSTQQNIIVNIQGDADQTKISCPSPLEVVSSTLPPEMAQKALAPTDAASNNMDGSRDLSKTASSSSSDDDLDPNSFDPVETKSRKKGDQSDQEIIKIYEQIFNSSPMEVYQKLHEYKLHHNIVASKQQKLTPLEIQDFKMPSQRKCPKTNKSTQSTSQKMHLKSGDLDTKLQEPSCTQFKMPENLESYSPASKDSSKIGESAIKSLDNKEANFKDSKEKYALQNKFVHHEQFAGVESPIGKMTNIEQNQFQQTDQLKVSPKTPGNQVKGHKTPLSTLEENSSTEVGSISDLIKIYQNIESSPSQPALGKFQRYINRVSAKHGSNYFQQGQRHLLQEHQQTCETPPSSETSSLALDGIEKEGSAPQSEKRKLAHDQNLLKFAKSLSTGTLKASTTLGDMVPGHRTLESGNLVACISDPSSGKFQISSLIDFFNRSNIQLPSSSPSLQLLSTSSPSNKEDGDMGQDLEGEENKIKLGESETSSVSNTSVFLADRTSSLHQLASTENCLQTQPNSASPRSNPPPGCVGAASSPPSPHEVNSLSASKRELSPVKESSFKRFKYEYEMLIKDLKQNK